MDWVIFYSDKSRFSNEDGEPADAPREGVQAIVQNDRILWRCECYCWEHNQWVEHDRFYADQYVSTSYHPIRLNGQTLPPEIFRPIKDAAVAYKKAQG